LQKYIEEGQSHCSLTICNLLLADDGGLVKGHNHLIVVGWNRLEMKGYSTISTALNDYVLEINLNRPEKLNSLNIQFFKDLLDVFNFARDSADVRVVILSGQGRVFSAGLDLAEMDCFPGTTDKDPAREAIRFFPLIRLFQEAITAIEKCNKPVIAAISGACIGGGVDLICACDIRFSSDDAFFCVKEVDIGLAADVF
jgi:enoyl-CoA hydratase/carnithine racemase